MPTLQRGSGVLLVVLSKEASFQKRPPVVWVVSAFSDTNREPSSDRYRYICEALTERGATVVLFVSAFNHDRKEMRKGHSTPWRCVDVFEPGYSHNVSVQRALSHAVFDSMLLWYLVRESYRDGFPDTILAALPHNGAACVAGVFSKFLGRHFVVDIHDTWPESVLSVAGGSWAVQGVYGLWKAAANFALICADDVFAESKRYAARANSIRVPLGRSEATTVYLGGDPAFYKRIAPVEVLPRSFEKCPFVAAYAGNLGQNSDLDCIIDAFSAFSEERPDAGLWFLGAGEREEYLKSRIARLGIRGWISGRIPYPMLLGYLKRAHVGLNCFRAGGNVAFSYKLNDYLLTGLPVINSLDGEAAAFIEAFDIGFNYASGDQKSLLEALRRSYRRRTTDSSWSAKVTVLAGKMFDRSEIYRDLIDRCVLPTTSLAESPSKKNGARNAGASAKHGR